MSGLAAGTRLGPYEVVGTLGEGGMGQVYRATDTRLDREVAIKVLPAHWADDAAMKDRFDREAQAIASLNHPHICALHDIGEHDGIAFLVMECLEGETLADCLERGPLTVNEALDVAIPILDALDQAHRRGVVHRDLKPANIMLTEAGPKLLDFGIAKTLADAAPNATATGVTSGAVALTAARLPATSLTTPGLVLGTLQYMAPEQLDGLEADARTDIFAFGAVLHEMISGAKAFEGESQALLISSIATSDPEPLSRAQPDAPAALEHAVKLCLAKDPGDRWQSARDLLAALRWIAEGGAAAGGAVALAAGSTGRTRRISALAAVAALVALLLALPAASYLTGASRAVAGEVHYRVGTVPASNPNLVPEGFFALSPDGGRMAWVAAQFPDTPALQVGRVGELSFERFPDTENVTQPFWSADGRAIAFIAGGKLRKVDASGGPPQDICDAPNFYGGSWNADGTIVFGTPAGVFRVSAEGGTPEAVTTTAEGEAGHYWPHFLPDGRRFLYLAWASDAGSRALFAASLDGREPTRVMPLESNAVYTGAGNLLFHREAALYARSFDAGALTATGDPVRIADGIEFSTASGRGQFDAARDGTLAYFEAAASIGRFFSAAETLPFQLVWSDWNGQPGDAVGPPGTYRGVELSPDGSRVALHRHDGAGGDVWVILPDNSLRRITFNPEYDNSAPVWSPDGTDLVYSSHRDGQWGLYRKPADGTGVEELLYESPEPKAPTAWSPDGEYIVFWLQHPQNSGDLWVLPLTGDGEPTPLVATPSDEKHGQISPDGRWIAYASNETVANVYEIYVQPFPSGPGRFQPSTAGGYWPRWGPAGDKLYFLQTIDFPHNNSILSAVDVRAEGDRFEHSLPHEVLDFLAVDVAHAGGEYLTWAIAPDGQRVLVFQRAPLASATEPETLEPGPDDPRPAIGVVIARNWEGGSARR